MYYYVLFLFCCDYLWFYFIFYIIIILLLLILLFSWIGADGNGRRGILRWQQTVEPDGLLHNLTNRHVFWWIEASTPFQKKKKARVPLRAHNPFAITRSVVDLPCPEKPAVCKLSATAEAKRHYRWRRRFLDRASPNRCPFVTIFNAEANDSKQQAKVTAAFTDVTTASAHQAYAFHNFQSLQPFKRTTPRHPKIET